jgi:hypothetical protein
MPGISQLKSAVQFICGDVGGVAETQKNFLMMKCPGVSNAVIDVGGTFLYAVAHVALYIIQLDEEKEWEASQALKRNESIAIGNTMENEDPDVSYHRCM